MKTYDYLQIVISFIVWIQIQLSKFDLFCSLENTMKEFALDVVQTKIIAKSSPQRIQLVLQTFNRPIFSPQLRLGSPIQNSNIFLQDIIFLF